MSGQLLPINQIDALPVATIAGVVQGTLYTVGGKIARYFSPTDLALDHVGLSSMADPNGNKAWYAATPYLNLVGCTLLSVLMVKTYGANPAAGGALTGFIQMRQGALDSPAPFYLITTGGGPFTYTFSDLLAGKYPLSIATIFDTSPGVGLEYRQLYTYGSVISRSDVGQLAAFGADCRIVFSTTATSATSPWNDATLTVSMWAS